MLLIAHVSMCALLATPVAPRTAVRAIVMSADSLSTSTLSEDVPSKCASLKGNAGKLEQKLLAMQAAVADAVRLADDVGTAADALAAFNSEKAELEAALEATNKENVRLSSALVAANSEKAELQAKVLELEEAVAEASVKIGALGTSVAKARWTMEIALEEKQDTVALRARLEAVEAELDDERAKHNLMAESFNKKLADAQAGSSLGRLVKAPFKAIGAASARLASKVSSLKNDTEPTSTATATEVIGTVVPTGATALKRSRE